MCEADSRAVESELKWGGKVGWGGGSEASGRTVSGLTRLSTKLFRGW